MPAVGKKAPAFTLKNQRGETTVKNGIATVILPSRNIETKLVIDGSGIDLKQ